MTNITIPFADGITTGCADNTENLTPQISLKLGMPQEKVLSKQEQYSICKQYIDYIIHSDRFHSYLNSDYFENTIPIASIYRNTVNTSPVIQIMQRKDLSNPEAINYIMTHYFLSSVESVFGERMGKKTSEIDTDNYLNLSGIKRDHNRTVPEFFLIYNKRYNLFNAINYSLYTCQYFFSEIIFFNHENSDFFILLARNNGNFISVLGHDFKKYRLANENFMTQDYNATIALCHDKFVFLSLHHHYSSTDKVSPGEYDLVPTTFPGDNINNVNIKHLENRDVIIIPLASKNSYVLALEQAKKIAEIANSVRISPFSFFNTTPRPSQENGSQFDKFLHFLFDNPLLLSNYNQAVLENGLKTVPEFEKFLMHYGVIANPHPVVQTTPRLSSFLKEYTSDGFDLKRILTPQYLSACYGQHHAGKTLFCYTLALSYALGFDVFGLKSTGKAPILYVDGENSGQNIAIKVRQIAEAYGHSGTDLDDFFHILPKQDEQFESLNSKSVQDIIVSRIISTKAKCIIFDNLFALAPESNRSPKNWVTLLTWFKEIATTHGIAVCYVHHLSDDGNHVGIKEIRMLTQNFFLLKRLGQHHNGASGCHMLLEIEKNKEYPQLHGTMGNFFLNTPNKNSSAEPWIMTQAGTIDSINAAYRFIDNAYKYDSSLNEIENEILAFVSSRGWVSNSSIVTHLKDGQLYFLKHNEAYSPETIRQLLINLCEKGKLKHNGKKTKGRVYALPEQPDNINLE